jgi:hypothetical protein
MRVRMRLGLFDNLTAADSPYLAFGLEDLASDSAQEANKIAAYEAMTLLQRGPLPFAAGKGGATLVIGFGANSTRALVANYVNQFCAGGDEACPAFPSIAAAIASLSWKGNALACGPFTGPSVRTIPAVIWAPCWHSSALAEGGGLGSQRGWFGEVGCARDCWRANQPGHHFPQGRQAP